MEEKIQNLENQVNSLQQKLMNLEAKLDSNMLSEAPRSPFKPLSGSQQ